MINLYTPYFFLISIILTIIATAALLLLVPVIALTLYAKKRQKFVLHQICLVLLGAIIAIFFINQCVNGVWLNVISSFLSLLGVICNASVIIANDGYMPVRDKTLMSYWEAMNKYAPKLPNPVELTGIHRLEKPTTKLRFLGDIFETKNKVFSIGDVFLMSAIPFAVIAGLWSLYALITG